MIDVVGLNDTCWETIPEGPKYVLFYFYFVLYIGSYNGAGSYMSEDSLPCNMVGLLFPLLTIAKSKENCQ